MCFYGTVIVLVELGVATTLFVIGLIILSPLVAMVLLTALPEFDLAGSKTNRTVIYGTIVVLAHLLVNIVHGLAHRKLHIELGLAATLFVIEVIILCPLAAMVLLWTPQRRLGLVLLALSMAGSFLFGLYKHFVEIGPDHVGRQVSGPWETTFVLTAYLLLFTEAIGSYIGIRFLGWERKA